MSNPTDLPLGAAVALPAAGPTTTDDGLQAVARSLRMMLGFMRPRTARQRTR